MRSRKPFTGPAKRVMAGSGTAARRASARFISSTGVASTNPATRQRMTDLALNGSGVRDTARVLGISPQTVMGELKKGMPRTSGRGRGRFAPVRR